MKSITMNINRHITHSKDNLHLELGINMKRKFRW